MYTIKDDRGEILVDLSMVVAIGLKSYDHLKTNRPPFTNIEIHIRGSMDCLTLQYKSQKEARGAFKQLQKKLKKLDKGAQEWW